MGNSLDIFQRLPNGVRMWVCSVGSVQEAKTRVLALQTGEPAEYFLCDLMERTVILASTPEHPALRPAPDDCDLFGKVKHAEPHRADADEPQFSRRVA